MQTLIPTKTLAERANLDILANVIRTVDGSHTLGAGALADAIADSGYLFDFADRVASDIQEATAAQIAADLRKQGLTDVAESVMRQYTSSVLV